MKNRLFYMGLGFSLVLLAGCSSDNNEAIDSNVPSAFRVDIPSAISQNSSLKAVVGDTLTGNEIYAHLNNFIYLGDASAELVEDIIISIRKYGLNEPMTFSYVSDEDQRTKKVTVEDNLTFEEQTWEHLLTVTDAATESETDGGKALQVFWNETPMEGIALLKPYNWDRSGVTNSEKTIFRVDYSEKELNNYSAHMIVTIYGWEETLTDRFHMDNLKMFVGKDGERIDVFGNSNHPDAWLFLDEPVGFNWAFVASGIESANIGVAQVGLPPSQLNETSHVILLETYSIKNVFSSQIREYFYQIFGIFPDQESINHYLQNTEAPGFFNQTGFIQGGTAPSADYDALVNALESLTPYNPYSVSNLELNFKE